MKRTVAVQPANDRLVSIRLFRLSIGVFFIGGFLASTVSLLVPRLTLIQGASYGRAALIQFAFYSSYLLFAVPIALMIGRIGYMRGIAAGLAIMTLACLLLVTGLGWQSYAATLVALLCLSAGQTFLQIASNTSVSMIGDPARAASRLTILQGFNSIGTVAGPLLGALPLLGDRAGGGAASPFLLAAATLGALAVAFALHRGLLAQQANAKTVWAPALADRRVWAGAAAIFAYVGAEVTIGALLTNFLVARDVLGARPVDAARLVSLYWAGAMVGRMVGGVALRWARPPVLLGAAAIGAAALTALGIVLSGPPAAAALLAVGLCNAIMFPTIYVLALPDQPERATAASTVLCMAVVGGAAVPLATGKLADAVGLAPALGLPASCYLVVLAFALWRRG